jgi:multiple sugar transport system ATP-binding protein
VRVGIRPQKVAVGTGDVRVRVVSNQWLGDQSHVAGECAGRLLIAVTPGKVAARPGDVISFSLEPRHLHIFGADGNCIRHAEVS